jgi:hypothetical protein
VFGSKAIPITVNKNDMKKEIIRVLLENLSKNFDVNDVMIAT